MNNSLRTFLALILLCGFTQPAHALTLINGGSVPGTISVAGGIDTYTFTATAGDSIQLSITGYIGMFMNLYEPNGTHIGTNNGDVITKSLTQGGTYTLEVSASDSNQTGNYDLYFVKVPGANEYGLFSDSDMRSHSITDGDLDSYTFVANAGDSIQLSISGDIGMFMNLYAPDGSIIRSNYSNVITENELLQSGTYTVVARSSQSHDTGNYDLYFVRVPGANEYGLLNIGGVVTGTIAPGDLDSYTFVANAGDSIQLSVSGDIGINMFLYAPDGSKTGGPNSGTISKNLTLGGTYTVITRSKTAFETGNYQLTFNRICSVMGDVAPVSATDCEVNAADLLVMTRIVLGLISPSAHQLTNGDLYPPGSPDGVIDIRDLILLTQMLIQ